MATKKKPTKKKPTKKKSAAKKPVMPATPTPLLCVQCKEHPVPEVADLLRRVCDLADKCRLRDTPPGENTFETKLATERWNQDLVTQVGTQLRMVKSHIRGLCVRCHYHLLSPFSDDAQGQQR